MSFIIPTLILCLLTISSTLTQAQSNKHFHNDTFSIDLASTDFGHIVKTSPKAVYNPNAETDIMGLLVVVNHIRRTPNSLSLGTVAARGRAHSIRGQAMAEGGIVVNMSSLAFSGQGSRIRVVTENPNFGPYVDVGGEQIWFDVLVETLKHGLSPVSWTDYLSITVGGTLSNAGISGQTFRFGPQIANVFELDVVTGNGDLVTCSRNSGQDLFYSVLGGLGQFGIITRARIALASAPTMAKWVRLLYNDFATFSKDQEMLISMYGRAEKKGTDYLEGFILMKQGPLDLSFYPIPDQLRVTSLVNQNGIVYAIELVKYYDNSTQATVEKDLEILLNPLGFVKGFSFVKDVSYIDFLNRVGPEEEKLRKLGLWDVPHPWLNLFVPKSQISKFDSGVFKGILLNQKVPAGLVIVYPMNRNKWDDKMSAVIPSEDVFYTIGLLHTSRYDEWQMFDNVNKQILQFCHDSNIIVKQYLPHYENQQDWIDHFGTKWDNFLKMKNQFDPNKILAPGHKIFTY